MARRLPGATGATEEAHQPLQALGQLGSLYALLVEPRVLPEPHPEQDTVPEVTQWPQFRGGTTPGGNCWIAGRYSTALGNLSSK